MYALVDCNNFYVSCERLFRPDLQHKPVVVLSNNDGCVISRSNQAKALGIGMGEPFFKIKPLLLKHDVCVMSSNYNLYQDMSRRVMAIIHQLEPKLEVYSIDEAFVELKSNDIGKLSQRAAKLVAKVLRQTGVPITVGVGATKTLAKLATAIAKQQSKSSWYLSGKEQRLNTVNIDQVWGLGKASCAKLNAMQIYTVKELQHITRAQLATINNINIARIVAELNGVICHQIQPAKARQQIVVSRSFGQKITAPELLCPLYNFCQMAVDKLHQEGSQTALLEVFAVQHCAKGNLHHRLQTELPQATDCIKTVSKTAAILLHKMQLPAAKYSKVGVALKDLSPLANMQQQLQFAASRASLTTLYQQLNSKFGKNIINFAAAKVHTNWQSNQHYLSPCYTTNWEDIKIVR